MFENLNLNPLENSFREFSEIVEKRRFFFENSKSSWQKSSVGEQYDLKTCLLSQTLESFNEMLIALKQWNKDK